MLFQVIFTGFVVLACLEQGFGLKCLQCKSKDVEGRCRLGQRSHHSATKRQSCFGKTAKCYAYATVTETGEPSFERGCTSKEMCEENENADIEFCFTCQSKFCNYNVMELDEEVENYLKEVLEYEKSLLPTTSTTTTTTQSPPVKTKRKHRTHMFVSPHNITSRNGYSNQGLVSNNSQPGNKTDDFHEGSTTEATTYSPVESNPITIILANDTQHSRDNHDYNSTNARNDKEVSTPISTENSTKPHESNSSGNKSHIPNQITEESGVLSTIAPKHRRYRSRKVSPYFTNERTHTTVSHLDGSNVNERTDDKHDSAEARAHSTSVSKDDITMFVRNTSDIHETNLPK